MEIKSLHTTPAISNAGGLGKIDNLGAFSRSQLYIYRMKIINRKLLTWVGAELKSFCFFAPHYS
jgi:hypothetical protein